MGTHKYFVNFKNGRIDYRRAIDLTTQEHINIDISVFQKAKSTNIKQDVEIHDYLYSFLSGFAHPDFVSAAYYVNERGFSAQPSKGELECIIYSSFVNVLLMDSLMTFSKLHPTSKRDIAFLLSKTLSSLLYVVKEAKFPAAFLERLELISINS